MTVENIYSIFIILLFVIFLVVVSTFYFDYRKHSSQTAAVYEALMQSGLLKKEDYKSWEKLGFWGFGFRVAIISRLLRGKRVKLAHSRWLEPSSCQAVFSVFNLTWIYSYNNKIKVATAIFLLLLILSYASNF